jgi:hypothetical protein
MNMNTNKNIDSYFLIFNFIFTQNTKIFKYVIYFLLIN